MDDITMQEQEASKVRHRAPQDEKWEVPGGGTPG